MASKKEWVARVAVAGTLLFAAAGCGQGGDDSGENSSGITEAGQNTSSDVKKYYPELAALELSESGSFLTQEDTNIRWYNFSDYTFNEPSAAATLNFMQNVVLPEGSDLLVKGAVLPMQRRDVEPDRVIFILPDEAPPPGWVLGTMTGEYPSAGTASMEDGTYVTYVQTKGNEDHPFFADEQDYTNMAFAIEACQVMIQVGAATEELSNDAQESVCNSFGTSYQFKQDDNTLGVYLQKVASMPVNTQIGFVPFPPAQYEYIAVVSPVLSRPTVANS